MSWSTSDELSFLRHLGSHRDNQIYLTQESQIELLRSYRRGVELRQNWGPISRAEILAAVDDRIRSLTLAKTQPVVQPPPTQEGDKT